MRYISVKLLGTICSAALLLMVASSHGLSSAPLNPYQASPSAWFSWTTNASGVLWYQSRDSNPAHFSYMGMMPPRVVIGDGALQAVASNWLITDGAPHTFVDTGWTFQFNGYGTGNGYGFWSKGNANFEFAYESSVWYHSGAYGGWQTLGSSGTSAAFIGNGAMYDLGNAWSYSYGNDNGYYYNAVLGLTQFAYNYSSGQWQNQGIAGGWGALGLTGLSAQFTGDGNWHDVGNGWYYGYNNVYGLTNGIGWWYNTNPGVAFAYIYNLGQWWTASLMGYGWGQMSFNGTSAAFVGDGNWHDVGYGWKYNYNNVSGYPTSGIGYLYNPNSGTAYAYQYTVGQLWYFDGTQWRTYGPPYSAI